MIAAAAGEFTEGEDLARRVEESEALHVLGLAANRTLDPEEVLTLVVRSARTLLGAHYVIISTHDGGELRRVAAIGMHGGSSEPDEFATRVVATGKLLVIDEPNAGVSGAGTHRAEGMKTGLGVPLSLFGTIFGAIIFGYRRPYSIQPRDTRLALTLAGHAAVAISNARLHRDLADRSAQLEQAYTDLRDSSAMKERFFANMSHELRTPLNSILGYQSLLLEDVVGPIPDPARTFLANAHRATRGLLHLVNDILDLSKIEAGKLDLNIGPVSISHSLLDAVETVRPLAEGKGLRLNVPPSSALAPLMTDPERLRQILVNLLSNAIKFTVAGDVTIEAALESDDGEWVAIRVSDTGPGIPMADRERVFQEFEQVTGTAGGGGTGLGLPISRKLARLLGGDLLLDIQGDAGATFLLRLPVASRSTP
jgi:signal transduction histidine kinase